MPEDDRRHKRDLHSPSHASEAADGPCPDLLDAINHEIRTPLGSILATVDAMLETELTAQQADMMGDVMVAGEQIQRLLSDLTQISQSDRDNGDCMTPQPSSGTAEPAIPAGLRIIVAEDVLLNRRALRHLMQPLGAELSFAVDGPQALTLLTTVTFDIALVDLRMPGMRGIEVVRRYREHEASLGPTRRPIFAFSAHIPDDEKRECAAAGFDGILTKPFKRRDLIAVIAASMAGDAAS